MVCSWLILLNCSDSVVKDLETSLLTSFKYSHLSMACCEVVSITSRQDSYSIGQDLKCIIQAVKTQDRMVTRRPEPRSTKIFLIFTFT